MAFHITIRQEKSEQVRVHGLISLGIYAHLCVCTFTCAPTVCIFICTCPYARDGHTVWFQIVMVTDGDAAPCASRRCYTFALHQSHGIPMPKKVTSNRNLEQWFGSAMITVGHWGIWNTMEYPCQPKGYNVGFCNFLIG